MFTANPTFQVNTHAYVCVSGGKKCSFFGKFGALCFLETPVLRFALLPYLPTTLSHVSLPSAFIVGFQVQRFTPVRSQKIESAIIGLEGGVVIFQSFDNYPF